MNQRQPHTHMTCGFCLQPKIIRSKPQETKSGQPICEDCLKEWNGVADMLWTLRATDQDSKRIASQLAIEFAEQALPIFEKRRPNDERPRKTIQAARDYLNGKISLKELRACRSRAADAAYAAAYAADADAAYAAAYAAYAAYAAAAREKASKNPLAKINNLSIVRPVVTLNDLERYTMKIEIKSRFSLQVLFSHECENNSIAITLAAAINAKANLYGANLRSADLRGANLYGANLRGANLYGANLGDANLYGANLGDANLYGANLGDANLRSANLRGANLGDANLYGANLRSADLRSANLGDAGKLTGDRPYFAVGPIGSRQDILAAFITEKGVYLRAGCFFGTVEQFREKLEGEHGDNVHGNEYRAALQLVLAHYKAWPAAPIKEPEQEAASE